jgi:hypothetical protein
MAGQYKTGDRHPTNNLTSFVQYDEEGHEIWTSIGRDIEAPYRLASLNAQRRSAGMRICSRTYRTEIQSREAVSNPRQTESQRVPLDKSRHV